jgi:hypothetical protein
MMAALALPAAASAEQWQNVSLMDAQCSAKAKSDADHHARSCALSCAKSGLGIVDKDGNYLKFDAKGTSDATKLLESSDKKDHLRVNVTGTRDGETIHVKSVQLL